MGEVQIYPFRVNKLKIFRNCVTLFQTGRSRFRSLSRKSPKKLKMMGLFLKTSILPLIYLFQLISHHLYGIFREILDEIKKT